MNYSKTQSLTISIEFIVFIFFLSFAFYIRKNPIKSMRIIFLGLVALVFGIFFNLQFSSYHILKFAKFSIYIGGFDNNFIFFILIPLFLLFTGNIYCGYLCPFGALQELVSEIFIFFKLKVNIKVELILKKLKYLLLIVILLSVLIKHLEIFKKFDLLTHIFTFSSTLTITLTLLLLFLSALNTRFWCKYLCPTGAFLTIFQSISTWLYIKLGKKNKFKKLYHVPHINKCDLGVVNIKDNNCICCDRCRYQKK